MLFRSIFIDISAGDPYLLEGNRIKIYGTNLALNVYAIRIRPFRDTIWEVFIDKNYYGDIQVGYTIDFPVSELTFDSVNDVNVSESTIKKYDTLNKVYVAHGLNTGDKIYYTHTSGTAIGSLTNNRYYYVIKIDDYTLQLATTLENANNSTQIIFTEGAIGTSHQLIYNVQGSIIPTASSYEIIRPGGGWKVGDIIHASTIINGVEVDNLMKVVETTGTVDTITVTNQGSDYTSTVVVDAETQVTTEGTATIAYAFGGSKIITIDGDITGAFSVGQTITGHNIVAGSKIESLGTGTGGAGTYILDIPATGQVTIGEGTIFDAEFIREGCEYLIVTVGSTDFTTLGADSNDIGTKFTATVSGDGTSGTGTVSLQSPISIVNATDIREGHVYKIDTVGTTDYTTLGSPDNNVDTVFVATVSGDVTSGDGTVFLGNTISVADIRKDFTYTIVSDANVGGGTVYTTNLIKAGKEYIIVSSGTTDFTLLGAADNNVRTKFTATIDGTTGSGTVSLVTDFTKLGSEDNDIGTSFVATADGNILSGTGTVVRTIVASLSGRIQFASPHGFTTGDKFIYSVPKIGRAHV